MAEKSYKATKKVTKLCNSVTFEEICSMQTKATELQSYKATDTIFLEDLFSSEEKATELQRYRATGTYFFLAEKKLQRYEKSYKAM